MIEKYFDCWTFERGKKFIYCVYEFKKVVD